MPIRGKTTVALRPLRPGILGHHAQNHPVSTRHPQDLHNPCNAHIRYRSHHVQRSQHSDDVWLRQSPRAARGSNQRQRRLSTTVTRAFPSHPFVQTRLPNSFPSPLCTLIFSLLSIIYSNTMKMSITLNPSNPAYSATAIPLKDLITHSFTLSACRTRSFQG
jgi:hypothetical protein